MRLDRCLACLTCFGATVGCARGDAVAGGPRVIVDTLGDVEWVRNSGTPPQWSLRLLHTIGTMEGTVAFGRIIGVLADDERRLYVADAQANVVYVFDSTASRVDSIGRPGRGPGEIAGLYGLAWLGDSLAVLDSRNARIGRFTRDGEWAGHWQHIGISGPIDWVKLYRASDAVAWTLTLTRGERVAGQPFVRLSSAGPRDTLIVPSTQDRPGRQVFRCGGERGFSTFSVPFSTSRSLTFAAGAMVVAWSDEYRLLTQRSASDTARVVEYERPVTPVSDAEWDSVLTEFRQWKETWSGARCEPRGEPTRPAAKPYVRAIWIDPDGRTWVEAQGPEGFLFDVFDADGRLAGSMAAPVRHPEVEPYVRDDRLYLVTRDELGVQRVAVYDVEERP
jgi:hypothetical protein